MAWINLICMVLHLQEQFCSKFSKFCRQKLSELRAECGDDFNVVVRCVVAAKRNGVCRSTCRWKLEILSESTDVVCQQSCARLVLRRSLTNTFLALSRLSHCCLHSISSLKALIRVFFSQTVNGHSDKGLQVRSAQSFSSEVLRAVNYQETWLDAPIAHVSYGLPIKSPWNTRDLGRKLYRTVISRKTGRFYALNFVSVGHLRTLKFFVQPLRWFDAEP